MGMPSTGISREIRRLQPYTVKLLWPGTEMVAGTGFFCHPEGFVLTARHVVDKILKEGDSEDEINLGWDGRPPWCKEKNLKAWFNRDRSPEQSDLAVLKVSLPLETTEYPFLPLDVFWRVSPARSLVSFGYPQGASWSAAGISIDCSLVGLDSTRLTNEPDLEGIELYALQGFVLSNVEGGFSGAPVLDCFTQKVIGLISAKSTPHQAFLAPLKPLYKLWKELRDFCDVCLAIRRSESEKAKREVDIKLGNTPWVQLELEQGELPLNTSAGSSERKTARHGRIWTPLERSGLETAIGQLDGSVIPDDQKRKLVLSADVGTGKTTFLRWLGVELLNKTRDVLPLFMTCEQARTHNDLEAVRRQWINERKGQFLAADLEYAFEKGSPFLLCDGLDQVPAHENDYRSFAEHAFALAGDNRILISSRPSALLTLESKRDVTFLGLRPFSRAAQQAYFGPKYYPEAVRLGTLSPILAQVPMLAFMLRTLIADGKYGHEATRTGLYKLYLDYTVKEHDANLNYARQNPSERIEIIRALSFLAYRALELDPPQIQRIDTEFYDAIRKEKGKDLPPCEKLARFGLINLICERGTDALYFTHQSYQEYLAALYVFSEKKAQIILRERWNSKWVEVIRFMAGLEGEPLIREILSHGDNVIYSNLFLAARCALQVTSLSPALRKSIEDQAFALAAGSLAWKEAIEALGELRACRPLLVLLESADPQKRRAALEALPQCREGIEPETVQRMKLLLKDRDATVRRSAGEALRALDVPLVEEHLQLRAATLQQLVPSARAKAIGTLAQLGERLDDFIIQQIAAYLEDPDPGVRLAVVETLDPLWDRLSRESKQQFGALTRDLNQTVRQAANWALRGSRRSWASLPDRLPNVAKSNVSPEPHRPRKAGRRPALGPAIVVAPEPLMLNQLEDPDPEVCGAAVIGLRWSYLDAKSAQRLAMRMEHLRTDARAEAIRIIGRSFEWLDNFKHIATFLEDPDSAVRQAAVQTLGRVSDSLDAEIIQRIGARLKDPDSQVRSAAISALGPFADPETFQRIAACLEDPASGVRRSAVRALGELVERLDPKTIQRVAEHLVDPNYNVCMATLHALTQVRNQLDPRTFRRIRTRLDHSNSKLREAALAVVVRLWERPDHATVQAVIARLSDEESGIREEAYRFLCTLYRKGCELPGGGLPAE
jgi:HEAT repeat protein